MLHSTKIPFVYIRHMAWKQYHVKWTLDKWNGKQYIQLVLGQEHEKQCCWL